ncbi:MAG: LptE family protein [Sphingobacteriaceae bacterium]
MKKSIFLLIFPMLLISQSCGLYKLNGASTIGLKTINVHFFENNAQLVVANLSQNFTEALKERIRSTTALGIVRGEANANLEGRITGYSITPAAIQATENNRAPIAGLNRLTITVSAKYTNEVDPTLNFEQLFSQSQDFSGDVSTREQALILEINKQLTEDIFNKAFANW